MNQPDSFSFRLTRYSRFPGYSQLGRFPAVAFTALALMGLLSCNPGKSNEVRQSAMRDTLQRKDAVNPYAAGDQSPMDLSYFPIDYPILKMNGTSDSLGLLCRVIYSRPQKNGRKIFGSDPGTLCQYGKEWRLGANEATEIEFFKTAIINGKRIQKGRYIIYCLPYEDKWTVILNTNLFTWGLHMDKTKDVVTIDIPVTVQSPALEDFTMVFEAIEGGANLVMAWDNVKAVLPIKVSS